MIIKVQFIAGCVSRTFMVYLLDYWMYLKQKNWNPRPFYLEGALNFGDGSLDGDVNTL